ncbi:MAG: MlaD family protein [Deltaproteobacteria bacterium]|jgi:phospholipid/cholesterol/gamma-HCH transport system substrate-binding protein/paraquat-inducible protein B|nr:MlaD family protein [Deltaproteobacteria bacterium]
MSKKTNFFKIGLFTLAAMVLLAAAVLYFGLSSAFTPVLECETFFDHSIQGLSVGSSVNFRGLRVGQVTAINIAAAVTPEGQHLIRVAFFLNPELITGQVGASVEDARTIILTEIAKSLKCILSYQGVSGLGSLDLDYLGHPQPPTLIAGADPRRLTIPGARGSMLAIGEALNSILNSLKAVDFGGLNHSLTTALNSLTTLSGTINDEIKVMSEALVTSLNDVSISVAKVSNLASSIGDEIIKIDLDKNGAELLASLRQFKETMAQAETMLRIPRTTLPQTMENLRVMSENFRDLSEMAKRYPSQLFFGHPPEEVKKW